MAQIVRFSEVAGVRALDARYSAAVSECSKIVEVLDVLVERLQSLREEIDTMGLALPPDRLEKEHAIVSAWLEFEIARRAGVARRADAMRAPEGAENDQSSTTP